jgi:acetyl esterase/lipase
MRLPAPFLLAAAVCAQAFTPSLATPQPDKTWVYRQAAEASFSLDIAYPKGAKTGEKYPALVFFHGGGWTSGHRGQFARQAEVLTAQCSLVVVSVDYPLNRNPLDATDAAQGAVCWLRRRAEELGIDAARVALAGASSGGQLAAAAALLKTTKAPECKDLPATPPAALVLFNPVLEIGGRLRASGLDASSVSPAQIVDKHLPPTLILQGTADRVTPVGGARRFAELARQSGAEPVKLVEYAGRSHGFFNDERGGDLRLTLDEATAFLRSLGWKV